MMHEKPKLSAWETVTLFGTVIRTLTTVLASSLTAPFRRSSGASTYKKHIIYSAVRTLTSSTSIRQSHAFADYTSEAYGAFAKSKGFAPQVVDMGDDTVGCWIGDKHTDTVLLWFHGGGYVLTGTRGHMELLWNIVLQAGKGGKKVAALVLQYDVAPYAQFPRQLIQATLAFRYLNNDLGLLPSQLIVGGDSAGGNLALALMSHILHPHPRVPELAQADQLFKGVILLSPWVTFDQSAPAFKTNAKKDVLSGAALRKWSNAFMGNATPDNYTSPLDATPDWWTGFPTNDILILAGGDEVFVDDIKEFAQILKISNEEKTEVFVAAGECHDASLLERSFRFEDGEQTRRLYEWVLKHR